MTDTAVIVEDSYASQIVLNPKEWMKGMWGSVLLYDKGRLSFAVAQSVSCVIPEILLTHFVCFNFNIKDTFHFDLPTSLTAVYHCSFVPLNFYWNAANIAIMISVQCESYSKPCFYPPLHRV